MYVRDGQHIVEPADFHDRQFLHDLPDRPSDSDLLERQQQAVLKQQEHDLRQMKNGRPGIFCTVICDYAVLCLWRWALVNERDFREWPCVRSIQTPGKSLCHNPSFIPTHRHWEELESAWLDHHCLNLDMIDFSCFSTQHHTIPGTLSSVCCRIHTWIMNILLYVVLWYPSLSSPVTCNCSEQYVCCVIC